MQGAQDETQPLVEDLASPRPAAQAVLYTVFDCARPDAQPCYSTLDGVDEVVIGRGAERSVTHETTGRLHLRLDDSFVSTVHARLVPYLQRWRIEDAGSRNKTLVNGAPTSGQLLADGDVIEVGGTFLLFRAAVVLPPGWPRDGGAWSGPARGLETILPGLARTFATLVEVARSSVSVVLHGEVGSGKEVIARAVHTISGRTGAYVAVNCGALPPTLIESELFGYRKGAFSGASEDRQGLVRAADGGTLFLDEIAELPERSQVAFLRVLQEHEVVPVGARRPQPVDVRVVSATHRDLPALVSAGEFRADLFSRLGGFALALPPLRARREDLGLLIAALLARLGEGKPPAFRRSAARCLFRHDWPGNVRELEKCLSAALVLAREGPIELDHLPRAMREPGAGVSYVSGEFVRVEAAPAVAGVPGVVDDNDDDEDTDRDAPLHEAEARDQLVALLVEHRGNVAAAAKLLGKAPVQIRRWMKRWGIDAERYRKE